MAHTVKHTTLRRKRVAPIRPVCRRTALASAWRPEPIDGPRRQDSPNQQRKVFSMVVPFLSVTVLVPASAA